MLSCVATMGRFYYNSKSRSYPFHQTLEVWKEVDEDKLRKDLQSLLDRGIDCIAVVLMHAHM